jgi:RNA polymerase sigma factor (sigma-70 family)
VLALNEALEQLSRTDSRKVELLELQYFAGLNYQEMAEVTGLSSSTLDRELRFAKAWLKKQLGSAQIPGEIR